MSVASATVKQELLSLKPEQYTVSLIVSKIAKTTKNEKDPTTGKRSFVIKPPEWDMQAKVHLNAGEYINEEAVDTTVGSIILNKLLIEGKIESIVPNHYYNEVMTASAFNKLVDHVSTCLMDNKIPLHPNVVSFLQAFEFYGLMLSSSISPSFTQETMQVQEKIREKRDELFAQHNNNPTLSEAIKIEDTLSAEAKKLLKDDPGMLLYNSGARGSFEDNYKNMAVMIGPVKNPATGKFDIVKSNYIDGVEKEDLPAVANIIVNAAYARAVGTAEGGYLTKQFYAVYQSITMDEHGTDCGSKGYLPIFLTESNFKDFLWQYIVDSGKLVLLTEDNAKQYINRVVKFRSPIGCLGTKICNKCMGERFYKLGIKDVGPVTGRLPNSIMNASLKQFHTTKMKLTQVDPNKLLIN